MKAGRSGDPISSLLRSIQARATGYNLPPVMVFDEKTAQQYLLKIAADIDRPVIEAGFGFQGVDVTVNPSQTGRTLNVEGTLKVLAVQLQTLQDGVVPVIVAETQPLLVDAAPLADSARKILSAPLELTVPNAGQDRSRAMDDRPGRACQGDHHPTQPGRCSLPV